MKYKYYFRLLSYLHMSSLNCNYCQRTNADFQLCPECSNAHYCSLGCLKLDRPSHEKVCGKEKNISEASSLSKTHETKLKLNKPSEECNETCNRCFASGPTKRCTGCLAVNYCSKKCQSEDWHTHKTECRHTTTIKGKHPYGGVQSAEESLKVTTQEQTVESPPNGYLWRLQNKCQLLYSPFKVISCIKMITQDPLDALMKVFVGFINKFSEREVNHGVYVLVNTFLNYRYNCLCLNLFCFLRVT